MANVTRVTKRLKNGAVQLNETDSLIETNSDVRSKSTSKRTRAFRAPLPYSRTLELGNVKCFYIDVYADAVSGSIKFHETISGQDNVGGTYYDLTPSFDSRLSNRALTKALGKLKRQNVNLAQAFFERGQTARLVSNNLIRVAKAGLALKRLDAPGVFDALGLRTGKRKHARIRPEGISDFWLEMQYGWKPLLSDIHGAVTQLHEVESEGSRLTAFVTGSAKDNALESRFLTTIGGGTLTRFRLNKYSRLSYKAFVRLDYVREDEIPSNLLTQLGFTNPLSLAWELVPFSFVVDWSLPLGEYFSLLDAASGWKLKGGSLSQKALRVTSTKFHSVDKGPNNFSSLTGGGVTIGRGRQMRFSRTIYQTSPVPPPPQLDTGASSLHIANGLALLASAFLAPAGARVR